MGNDRTVLLVKPFRLDKEMDCETHLAEATLETRRG